MKDKEECYTFFEDVCTINEILSLSQRFEVAHMLRQQKTYLDIAEKTGGFHRNHQSCQPFSELWKRRIRYGICQNAAVGRKVGVLLI